MNCGATIRLGIGTDTHYVCDLRLRHDGYHHWEPKPVQTISFGWNERREWADFFAKRLRDFWAKK